MLKSIIAAIPAVALLVAGICVESIPIVLIGIALASIHYELHKIKVKIENSQPWWY